MLSSEGKCASAHGERGRPAQRPNSIPPQSPRADLKRSGYRQRLSLEQRRILGQVEPRPSARDHPAPGEPSLGVPAEIPATGILGELDAPGRRLRTAALRHPRSAMEPRRAPPQKGAESHGRPARRALPEPRAGHRRLGPLARCDGMRASVGKRRGQVVPSDRENCEQEQGARVGQSSAVVSPQNEPRHEQRRQGGARRPAVRVSPLTGTADLAWPKASSRRSRTPASNRRWT